MGVSVLQRAPQTLDEYVVHPPPAAIQRDAHTGLGQHGDALAAGELASLSALAIQSLPKRASAASAASTQNEAFIVFDSRQLSAARLAQFMTATRYRQPRPFVFFKQKTAYEM